MCFFRIILLIFIYTYNISHTEVILLDNNTNNNIDEINTEKGNSNQNKTNKQKTSIKFEPNILNNIGKKDNNKEGIITYFTFGTKGKPVINVYISPSCLHCAQFLAEDLQKFVDKHGSECFIKVILTPVSAKDFFVMKIIQAKTKNLDDYRRIFSDYMKRAIATIDRIRPTDEQKALYIGSNTDPDMIKYQVIAKEFGFTDEEIVNAIPNMDGTYESKVLEEYGNTMQEISNTLQLDRSKQQEIDVPLIICNGKKCKTLNEAFKLCSKNM